MTSRSFSRAIAATLAGALLWLAAAMPAGAQFADQAQFGGTAGGSANAQSITIPGYIQQAATVLRFLPVAANTGPATLAVSGLTAQNVLKWSPTGALVALSGQEIQPAIEALVTWDGTQFELLNPQANNTHAASFGTSGLPSLGTALNLTIGAATGSNILTITLTNAAGSNATPASPIVLPFRTAAGAPALRSVTAGLSIAIAASNTMGCVSGVVCRLWITAIDNGGTIALCAIRATTATQIYPLNEGALYTSASGTTGGSVAGTLYCSTSAVASSVIKILGYVEATETTGNWGSVGAIQLFGPGIYKPGESMQALHFTTTTATTGSASVKVDLSGFTATPQIAPQSVANFVRIRLVGNATAASGANGNVQLFRTADTNPIGNPSPFGSGVAATSMIATVVCEVFDNPQTTSLTTYGAFVSVSSTGVVWLNAAGIGAGGPGILTIEEIQGALPEPANDDGGPMRMVG